MNYEIVLFIMLNGGVPVTFATHGMFIFKLLNKSVITNSVEMNQEGAYVVVYSYM